MTNDPRTTHTPSTQPSYAGPASLCECGHTGDGPTSQHVNRLADHTIPAGRGHGYCLVRGCKCEKFRWAKFLPAFLKANKAGAL